MAEDTVQASNSVFPSFGLQADLGQPRDYNFGFGAPDTTSAASGGPPYHSGTQLLYRIRLHFKQVGILRFLLEVFSHWVAVVTIRPAGSRKRPLSNHLFSPTQIPINQTSNQPTSQTSNQLTRIPIQSDIQSSFLTESDTDESDDNEWQGTMAEDTVQASNPVFPSLGRQADSGQPSDYNFGFGATAPASAASSGPPYHSGNQLHLRALALALQNLSPFQAGGNLEVSAESTFSLGSGGGDKASWKFKRVDQNKPRKM